MFYWGLKIYLLSFELKRVDVSSQVYGIPFLAMNIGALLLAVGINGLLVNLLRSFYRARAR